MKVKRNPICLFLTDRKAAILFKGIEMQSASPVVTESVSIVVIKILVVENFFFKDYYFIDVLVVEDNITCQIAHNVYPKYRN